MAFLERRQGAWRILQIISSAEKILPLKCNYVLFNIFIYVYTSL